MSSTTFQKDLTNDFLFGGVSFTPPANYYAALSTTTVSPSGSNISEPVAANYSRLTIPNTKSYFTYSSSGCLVNSSVWTFPTSSGSWGTMIDLVLYDAVSSGSPRFYTTLTNPVVVQTNTTVSFSASQLVFSQA